MLNPVDRITMVVVRIDDAGDEAVWRIDRWAHRYLRLCRALVTLALVLAWCLIVGASAATLVFWGA